MSEIQFPRTNIGGVSVSRLIAGTNNIMGGSHRTKARDTHIKNIFNRAEAVADIVETYLYYGVDTIIGRLAEFDFAVEGIKIAEERTGKHVHHIELAVFDTADNEKSRAEAAAHIRMCAARGCEICLPLHVCVERMVNKQKETIDRIGDYLYMIREAGMVPGLSAHMPEVVTYSDANGYDVETYIQIYNAAGFLMQVEVELVHEVIHQAKKPVITIKPMAAGHLNPFVGLNFVWNTIREHDAVAVGCMTSDEVDEVVEYSLAAMERRVPVVKSRTHQY